MRALCVSFLSLAGAVAVQRRSSSNASALRENAAFMITSGMTAAEELCLTVESGLVDVAGSEVVLMKCLDAIAAGDGRELFSFQSGGLLMSVVGKQCLTLSGDDVTAGGVLVLDSCDAAAAYTDGRAKFELRGAARVRSSSTLSSRNASGRL